MQTDLQRLLEETLELIRGIRANLNAIQAMLLAQDALLPMIDKWATLERLVCSAKLAIVRDEFAARFPDLDVATEGFTFGVVDEAADRYLIFLQRRQRDDIFNLTVAIIEDTYEQEPGKRIPGIAHFTSNLTQVLQAYSQSIEQKFHPFAVKFGRPDPERA